MGVMSCLGQEGLRSLSDLAYVLFFLLLFSSVSDLNRDVERLFPAIIHNDTLTRWAFPMVLRSSCEFDVTYFPWDRQHCDLIFGSWNYHGGKVGLNAPAYGEEGEGDAEGGRGGGGPYRLANPSWIQLPRRTIHTLISTLLRTLHSIFSLWVALQTRRWHVTFHIHAAWVLVDVSISWTMPISQVQSTFISSRWIL